MSCSTDKMILQGVADKFWARCPPIL